jgi:hypothetical protein
MVSRLPEIALDDHQADKKNCEHKMIVSTGAAIPVAD